MQIISLVINGFESISGSVPPAVGWIGPALDSQYDPGARVTMPHEQLMTANFDRAVVTGAVDLDHRCRTVTATTKRGWSSIPENILHSRPPARVDTAHRPRQVATETIYASASTVCRPVYVAAHRD